jgi:hypothetical protein
MHQHLSRRIAVALQLAAVEIRNAHHVRRHEPLADALRGHHQAVFAKANADVAGIRIGVFARVHAPAHFDDIGADLGLDGHAVRASTRARYASRQVVEQKNT